MNPIRHGLLAMRTAAVTPSRHRRLALLASEGKAPVSVLFYHRVADTAHNTWTIGCRRFQEQIEYCRQHFDLIDLREVQQRMQGGRFSRPAISLTFDDGYEENSAFALPLLTKHRIPCTYFVCTSNIIHGRPFPQDVAAGHPLPVNTVDQIRAAADAGIEIGCHTRSHVDFSKIEDPAIVREEIIDAKAELESLIDRPVEYFAFPYGMPEQLTQAAVDAVVEAGFQGFCSAYGAYNFPGDPSFHIRRIHGDPEMARFKNWLSFDARKARHHVPLKFQLPSLPIIAPTPSQAVSLNVSAAP